MRTVTDEIITNNHPPIEDVKRLLRIKIYMHVIAGLCRSLGFTTSPHVCGLTADRGET